MKAADLRKSILQYAVEGKLVKQDIHDEPADMLYDKIIKEKENLIKQGKIKKEKQLPPITDDEIPYDIPNNWKWVRLGEICELNPRNKLEDNLEVSFIPMKLISDGYQNQHTYEIKKWKDIKNGFTHFKENDILVSKITPCFQNLKSCIAKNLVSKYGAGTTEIHILRPFIVYNLYILYFLKTPNFIKNGIKNMTGTAGQQRVPINYISTYLFPLPPLKEQERIVKKVDELMALCDKLEQEEEKLLSLDKHFADTLPKSILQYAVEGKLVQQNIHDEPASMLYDKIIKEKENLIKQGKIKKEKPLPPITDDEIPYDIPNNWKWVRLGEVCNLSIGKTPERKIPEYWKDGIYNWVSISDMINGGLINQTKEKISQIAYNKVFKKDTLPIGTLLFSFKLTIGKVSLLNIPAYTNEAICAITPYLYDNIKYYLFKILPILNLLDNANDAIKGKTLNLQTLPLILIPLPPLKEQERIVKKVDELLTYCNKLKDII